MSEKTTDSLALSLIGFNIKYPLRNLQNSIFSVQVHWIE